jgi:hypothetical protein
MITFCIYWKSVMTINNMKNINNPYNCYDGSYVNRGVYFRRKDTIRIFNKKKK